MDGSLESALRERFGPSDGGAAPGTMAGRSLEEWNVAYTRVERYFHALQLRNKVVLGQLVLHVLQRAMERAPAQLQVSATELAVQEMDRLIINWFGQILGSPPAARGMLATRGRLALLLADMPGRWQDQFLTPGPWPDEFVNAMRQAYLRAGPEFQLTRMSPRPLDLGGMAVFVNLSQSRRFKLLLYSTWAVLALFLVFLFVALHRL
jgi:hypothetical protein